MDTNQENFLLELLVEEIPARFQEEAIANLKRLMVEKLEKQKIKSENIKTYVSPRRMVFLAQLEQQVPAFVEEKKGPQASAPPNVIAKFLQSLGISPDDCSEKVMDKKIFLVAHIRHPQRHTLDLLPHIVAASIREMQWPKSMHWGTHAFNFVRPIRNILCRFCDESVNIELGEINLKSTDYTFGHRFMSSGKIFAKNPSEYREKIKEAFVIIDPIERKNAILAKFTKNFSKPGVSVDVPEDLLDEVVGLVENPIVLLGQIPQKFMRLPEEALVTPMRVHQRYFPVRRNGILAPFFAFVANNAAEDDGKEIIKGNERVLNARLADALFFYETDLQKPLELHLENLKKIVFHEKLGTVFARILRICCVCDFICEEMNLGEDLRELLKRVALLSKCDLSTHMVSEFPELQGIMGGIYAAAQGENKAVCSAIGEQYKTVDEIASLPGALFSIADKIEIITGFFAIEKGPTGSKDPFALRRAAIGLIKIIKKYDLSLQLRAVVRKTFGLFNFLKCDANTVEAVIAFILDRLKIVLKESGISHEVVAAVVECDDDIMPIFAKAEILDQTLKNENGKKLITSYKRSKNILEQFGDFGNCSVDRELLTEDGERNLLDELEVLEIALEKLEISGLDPNIEFQTKISLCIALEKKITTFFRDILVNSNDEKIRFNRIGILLKLTSIFERFLPEIARISVESY
ncbi:MAG: glycine--tRNA ligase subunit beta [Holosporaceae bacterium]|jgi:glycyl-tRNA synthetase beta chain|nr:glycine--tRNA ligase subunit beta [Holosporaceae bacterium]